MHRDQSTQPCVKSPWARRTANNTAPRRLVVLDHWIGQGIGNQLRGSALWLTLAQRSDRALRFAPCLPPEQLDRYNADLQRRGFAADMLPLMPSCNRPDIFDLHEHFTFRGLGSLQASADDLRSAVLIDVAQPAGFKRGSCSNTRACASAVAAKLDAALFGSRAEPVLAVVLFHNSILMRMAHHADPCLRHVQPLHALHVPPCDVGLHVRTLTLDDVRCNTLTLDDTDACPSHIAGRLNMAKRDGAWAWGEPWPQNIDGCPGGRRFVTSDAPSIYATTRQLGWRDLKDAAETTWTEHTQATGREVARRCPGRFDQTIAAWWALAQCTRAIIAPIKSTFSETAATAAGVPYVPTCRSLNASRAVSRAATRLAAERAAARRRRRQLDAQWLDQAQRGFCGITAENDAGDCRTSGAGPAQGSLQLPMNVSVSWHRAARWCEGHCRHCARCRYVSIGRKLRDCSWFHDCDLARLRVDVPGFRTVRVRQQQQQQQQYPS